MYGGLHNFMEVTVRYLGVSLDCSPARAPHAPLSVFSEEHAAQQTGAHLSAAQSGVQEEKLFLLYSAKCLLWRRL